MESAGPIMSAYWGETHLHPAAAVGLAVTFLAVLLADRRSVPAILLPMLVMIAGGQRLVVGGVDLGILRLLGLFAVIRFGIRQEFNQIAWRPLDLIACAMAVLPLFCSVLRGETATLMMHAGMGFDLLAMYLVGRVCLENEVAWTRMVVVMAVLSVPISLAFANEKLTARNVFSVFGGVPEITRVRFGKLRAQGAFAHPIMAGAWVATFFPLYVGVLRSSRTVIRRIVALVGILCGLVMVLSVDSATAVAGLIMAGALVLAFRVSWIFRYWKSAVVLAVLLHFVTKSGLHGLLFTRISLVSGSTGYHRYRLYDAALARIPEWFFFGTHGTDHWGWHLFDVTSEYVISAVRGGICGLVCIIVLQLRPIYEVGRARLRMSRRGSILGYHIAAAVALQAFMMLSVSYFGQAIFLLAALPGGAISFAGAASCPCSFARSSVARLNRNRELDSFGLNDGREPGIPVAQGLG